MKCIRRRVYTEVENIYELEIDNYLVEDCREHLATVLENPEDAPEIDENLIERIFDNYEYYLDLDDPVKVKGAFGTVESTIRDELIDFLTDRLDDSLVDTFYGDENDNFIEVGYV